MEQLIRWYYTTEAIEMDLPYWNSKGYRLIFIFKDKEMYFCLFEREEVL